MPFSSRFRVGAGLLSGMAATLTATAVLAAAAGDDLVARGKYLTTAGDCVACHSAPSGKPFSGGLPMPTPYGIIYTPNITPDKETGIGSWSDDQFYRAMHEGIAKDGSYLYPVFPYPEYTKVKREDVQAIRAYLNTLPPVHAPQRPNTFSFPYNIRSTLAVWRELYFTPGDFQPNPKATPEVNRGAYLVLGLEHCGECHTERNTLGATKKSRNLAGASLNGWYAPNITSDMRDGIGGWSNDELYAFLKNGATPKHGIAVGPMSEVVHESTHNLADADLRAIVAYLKATPPKQDNNASQSAVTTASANTYLTFCASCHQVNGKGLANAVPALDGNGAVTAGGPENVIKLVLGGHTAYQSYGPMPAYASDMSDEEIADVVNYVRTAWSNKAKSNATTELVASARPSVFIALSGKNPECPPHRDFSATAKAIADPNGPLASDLKGVKEANLLQGVNAIIAKTKVTEPSALNEDIVNGLTAAYCPVLAAQPGKKVDEQRWRLHQFSALVYTQLVSGKDKLQ